MYVYQNVTNTEVKTGILSIKASNLMHRLSQFTVDVSTSVT